MIGVVICTHDKLADALLETVGMIVGEFPNAVAVPVRPGEGPEQIRDHIAAAVASVDEGAGVVILCDMFGGTPSNLSLSLLADDREVITGVNLPMLLKLYTHRDGPLAEVASAIAAYSRESIHVAGDLLRGRK
jgi:PTS system mannose-specific IIA component